MSSTIHCFFFTNKHLLFTHSCIMHLCIMHLGIMHLCSDALCIYALCIYALCIYAVMHYAFMHNCAFMHYAFLLCIKNIVNGWLMLIVLATWYQLPCRPCRFRFTIVMSRQVFLPFVFGPLDKHDIYFKCILRNGYCVMLTV